MYLPRINRLIFLGLCILITLPMTAFANTRNLERVDEGKRFSKEDRVAVIVGVNNYRRSGLRSLNYATADAEALGKFFESQGYLVEVLKDGEAQKNYILRAIRKMGELMNPGKGTLVFAFSGHGFGSGDSNYLAVSGTDADDISGTGLALADVRKAIKSTGARRRVLLVDACREDHAKGGGGKGFFNEDSEGENILYSTRAGKLSYEDDSLGHGAFTHYLLKGLKGEAAEDGLVTFTGLAGYVSKQVKHWVYRKHSVAQVPYRAGENTGVFVLAKADEGRQLFEPELVKIKGGCYQMGSPEDETDRGGDERQHRVCVEDFQLGKTEVTVEQFRVFVDTTGYRSEAEKDGDDKTWRKPGFTQGEDHPVVKVSWNDAVAYTEWLSKETRKAYRLPTEAEWEYAARAGSKTAYPWGNQISRDKANCYKGCGDSHQYTAPVASFSAYGGLHDMIGNVWEWTCSKYDGDYGGDEKECASKNDASGRRALRGGSWDYIPGYLRSAYRYGSYPTFRSLNSGFRVARTR